MGVLFFLVYIESHPGGSLRSDVRTCQSNLRSSFGAKILPTPGVARNPWGLPTTTLSPFAATFISRPASVAYKGLTEFLNPLDATPTKNPGWGPLLLGRTAKSIGLSPFSFLSRERAWTKGYGLVYRR